MNATYHQRLYFADSFSRENNSFLKQLYDQIRPEALQSRPSVCGFNTINATFHLFKFRREEFGGVQDNIVLSFMKKCMYSIIFSEVNV